MALDLDLPVRDRFPAARGARSLNFWGRRDRTFHGLKRRGVGGSGIYLGFLSGTVGRSVWLFSNLLCGSGDRPSLSANSDHGLCLQISLGFPSFELEPRFQPTRDDVYRKGPLVERLSKGRVLEQKLRANSLNV